MVGGGDRLVLAGLEEAVKVGDVLLWWEVRYM